MESIIQPFLLVLLSEMGDKTQLLALILTMRFKKPWPIMAGILVATILNHSLASFIGHWASGFITPLYLKWLLASLFIGFAFWILIPDKEDELKQENKYGAFLTTTVAFFFAEMGDKTQLATIALGAQYQDVILVTLGTTLGMLVADGLAVFMGDKLLKRISMNVVRYFAAGLFFVFGLLILFKK